VPFTILEYCQSNNTCSTRSRQPISVVMIYSMKLTLAGHHVRFHATTLEPLWIIHSHKNLFCYFAITKHPFINNLVHLSSGRVSAAPEPPQRQQKRMWTRGWTWVGSLAKALRPKQYPESESLSCAHNHIEVSNASLIYHCYVQSQTSSASWRVCVCVCESVCESACVCVCVCVCV
jgi:hypothetical protein